MKVHASSVLTCIKTVKHLLKPTVGEGGGGIDTQVGYGWVRLEEFAFKMVSSLENWQILLFFPRNQTRQLTS